MHRVVLRATACLPAGLFAATLAAALPACSTLPRPSTGPTPRETGVEVPFPPPPARVEFVPDPKSDAEVWVDGQWDWDGDGWKWLAGSWMVPPEGAYFTRWSTYRRSDGRLFFVRAAWRDRNGKPLGGVFAHDICPREGDPSP